jgi:hypothetical protein
MAFLIDTNIPLRSMQLHHLLCALAQRSVKSLRSRGEGYSWRRKTLSSFGQWQPGQRARVVWGFQLNLRYKWRLCATAYRVDKLLRRL